MTVHGLSEAPANLVADLEGGAAVARKSNRTDELIEEITTDAHGYDEQLWAFLNAFEEELGEPVDAHMLGEPVQVESFAYDGNERRGLTAKVRKDGSTWSVALADVEFATLTREADLVDALRQVMGLKPVERKKATKAKKQHKAQVEDVEVGKPVDVLVLQVKQNATRLKILSSGRLITLRAALRAVPGQIATITPKKVWSFNGHPYMSADEVTDLRVDVSALGLVPLKVRDYGDWDPSTHPWGDEPLEEWAQAILGAGPRPDCELEVISPSFIPSSGSTVDGPLVDAMHLLAEGEREEARQLFEEILAEDLRCLDAHAHLGQMVFEFDPREALRYFAVGVEIGNMSLGPEFKGLLRWGITENRPFLRCLQGQGLCLWRQNRGEEARAVFERLLRLNPTDNQGVRFLLADLKAGRTWEESCQGEEASCPF